FEALDQVDALAREPGALARMSGRLRGRVEQGDLRLVEQVVVEAHRPDDDPLAFLRVERRERTGAATDAEQVRTLIAPGRRALKRFGEQRVTQHLPLLLAGQAELPKEARQLIASLSDDHEGDLG